MWGSLRFWCTSRGALATPQGGKPQGRGEAREQEAHLAWNVSVPVVDPGDDSSPGPSFPACASAPLPDEHLLGVRPTSPIRARTCSSRVPSPLAEPRRAPGSARLLFLVIYFSSGFVASVSIYTGGLGITISHELVHKSSRAEQWLGAEEGVVLLCVLRSGVSGAVQSSHEGPAAAGIACTGGAVLWVPDGVARAWSHLGGRPGRGCFRLEAMS